MIIVTFVDIYVYLGMCSSERHIGLQVYMILGRVYLNALFSDNKRVANDKNILDIWLFWEEEKKSDAAIFISLCKWNILNL